MKRTIRHTDHTDIETLIDGVWAVTKCNSTMETKMMILRDVRHTDQGAVADVLLDGAILPISIPLAEYLFPEREQYALNLNVRFALSYENPVDVAQLIEREMEELDRLDDQALYTELRGGL